MSEPVDPGAPPDAPAPGHVTLQIGQGDGPNPLDYILVVGVLCLVAFGMYELVFAPKIDAAVLPVISGLLSFVTGTILGGYAGFRWGSSAGSKSANAALAKIAGAQ